MIEKNNNIYQSGSDQSKFKQFFRAVFIGKNTANNLVKYGHTVDLNDKVKAMRASLGLPEVPPTVLASEKASADFAKLLAKTGFDKLVE